MVQMLMIPCDNIVIWKRIHVFENITQTARKYIRLLSDIIFLFKKNIFL